jgi:hypothetical protein
MHHWLKIIRLILKMILLVLASIFVFLKSAKVEMRKSFELATIVLSKLKLNAYTDNIVLIDAYIQFDRLSHYQ